MVFTIEHRAFYRYRLTHSRCSIRCLHCSAFWHSTFNSIPVALPSLYLVCVFVIKSHESHPMWQLSNAPSNVMSTCAVIFTLIHNPLNRYIVIITFIAQPVQFGIKVVSAFRRIIDLPPVCYEPAGAIWALPPFNHSCFNHHFITSSAVCHTQSMLLAFRCSIILSNAGTDQFPYHLRKP